MSDVIKNTLYRQRRTFNKSCSKVKTWHCKSIAKRINEQKLESSLIKSLSEKIINSVDFGSGRRRTWSCRRYSVQWRRAVSASQHPLRAELHIENNDFELNYRTIGLTDYYWTISDGLTGYRTIGLGLGLVLGVRYSPLVRCIIKCDPYMYYSSSILTELLSLRHVFTPA